MGARHHNRLSAPVIARRGRGAKVLAFPLAGLAGTWFHGISYLLRRR